MLLATQARTNSDYQKRNPSYIADAIEEASNNGKYSVLVTIKRLDAPYITESLENKGYAVTFYPLQRKLKIEWNS